MRLLRELSRRKLRTTLTILGITIGIWALVVFSSMANKINALVEGGSQYLRRQDPRHRRLLVRHGTDEPRVGRHDPRSRRRGRRRPADPAALRRGSRRLVRHPGADHRRHPRCRRRATSSSSSSWRPGGCSRRGRRRPRRARLDLGQSHDVTAGDTIEIRGRDFEVIGTLQPTLTAPDTTAIVPLSAAQELFIETLPPLITDCGRARGARQPDRRVPGRRRGRRRGRDAASRAPSPTARP